MGGKSSSSSSTDQSTRIDDSRAYGEAGAIVASGNARLNVESVDQEVVDASFDLAKTLAGDLADFAKDVTGESLQIVADKTEDAASTIAGDALRYGLLSSVALAGIMLWIMKGKR